MYISTRVLKGKRMLQNRKMRNHIWKQQLKKYSTILIWSGNTNSKWISAIQKSEEESHQLQSGSVDILLRRPWTFPEVEKAPVHHRRAIKSHRTFKAAKDKLSSLLNPPKSQITKAQQHSRSKSKNWVFRPRSPQSPNQQILTPPDAADSGTI